MRNYVVLLVLAIVASASSASACWRDGEWIFNGEYDPQEGCVHRGCYQPEGPIHRDTECCNNRSHEHYRYRSCDPGRRGGHRGRQQYDYDNIHLTTDQLAIVEGARLLRHIIRPRRQQQPQVQVVVVREEAPAAEPEVQEQETRKDCKTLVNAAGKRKVKVVIDGELIELEPREKRNKCSSEVTDVDASVRVGTRVELHLRYEDKPIDWHLEEADPTDTKYPYEQIVFAEVKK